MMTCLPSGCVLKHFFHKPIHFMDILQKVLRVLRPFFRLDLCKSRFSEYPEITIMGVFRLCASVLTCCLKFSSTACCFCKSYNSFGQYRLSTKPSAQKFLPLPSAVYPASQPMSRSRRHNRAYKFLRCLNPLLPIPVILPKWIKSLDKLSSALLEKPLPQHLIACQTLLVRPGILAQLRLCRHIAVLIKQKSRSYEIFLA